MHKCRYFKWPSSNADFWKQKIEGNALRDLVNYEKLIASGWVYLVLWECVLRELKGVGRQARLEQLGQLIEQFLESENRRCMEIDATGLHLHFSPEPVMTSGTL
jgi:DNA mismatch endonuclease (patch repair protein)